MKQTLIALMASTFLAVSPASADPLPLKLSIEVEDVDGVKNFKGGKDALEALIRKTVEDYLSTRFQAFWSIDPQSPHHTLAVLVEMDEDSKKPELILQFGPEQHPEISGISSKSVGRLAQNSAASKFKKAVKRALKSSYNDMFQRSEAINNKWDFGVLTKLTISRELADHEKSKFRDNQLVIHWPYAHRTTPLNTAPPVAFSDRLALPPNLPRKALVFTQPHTGIKISKSETTAELCIHRKIPSTPTGVQPEVFYTCSVSGSCTMVDAKPAGWAEAGCSRQGSLNPILQELFGIKSAQATEKNIWTVPTVNKLQDRLKQERNSFVGFVDFEIESGPLTDIDADSYTISIFSDGTPIWIDGIPPEKNRRRFAAEDGLLVRFAIENLHFAARDSGCERLKARFQFFRGDEPVGDPVTITRDYAAMRHARPSVSKNEFSEFEWSGHYYSPKGRKESGLFVISSEIFHRDDKEAAAKAREFLNGMRRLLDSFNWTMTRQELGGNIGDTRHASSNDTLYVAEKKLRASSKARQNTALLGRKLTPPTISQNDTLRIVGKLRPPTKARDDGGVAYGLLAALEDPNGQLQFTFDAEQIKRLRAKLLSLRATKSAAAKVIPAKKKDFYPYTYTEKRKDAPNWVCHL